MTTSTQPAVMSASTLTGDTIRNRKDETLGTIEDIMIDIGDSRIAYAVLSVGGFLGMGDKYFAVPWDSLELDTANKCMVLNTDKEAFEKAPGFDKDNWPDFADRVWGASIYNHYNVTSYWS